MNFFLLSIIIQITIAHSTKDIGIKLGVIKICVNRIPTNIGMQTNTPKARVLGNKTKIPPKISEIANRGISQTIEPMALFKSKIS